MIPPCAKRLANTKECDFPRASLFQARQLTHMPSFERSFKSRGVLITTYAHLELSQETLQKVLHENVTTRLVGMMSQEMTVAGTPHVHVMVMTLTPRRWIKSNILKQLGIVSCHLRPIENTQQAVNTCSYLAKTSTPIVWATTDQLAQQWKHWTFNSIFLLNAKWRNANFRPSVIQRLEDQMARLDAAGWNRAK